jgi:hypothetical protein
MANAQVVQYAHKHKEAPVRQSVLLTSFLTSLMLASAAFCQGLDSLLPYTVLLVRLA